MIESHPEFGVVIAQMRSLEASFLSETPGKPIVAKDLLAICEAVHTLAQKMSQFNAAKTKKTCKPAELDGSKFSACPGGQTMLR